MQAAALLLAASATAHPVLQGYDVVEYFSLDADDA